MKISKILVHKPSRSFFWDEDMINGLCVAFISKFIGKVPDRGTTSVSVKFSANNPKKKGFLKILRTGSDEIKLGDDVFQLCYHEIKVLNDAGINIDDSFWIKVEKL
jgi:hypothetical protein